MEKLYIIRNRRDTVKPINNGLFGHPISNNIFYVLVFNCPRRPNLGREGRPIVLRANHFQISMPRGFVHHYDINIQPDKCPRKVNREIIETMVHAYSKIFGNLKPVFDGRNNLYTRDPLPIGNDRMELEVSNSVLVEIS